MNKDARRIIISVGVIFVLTLSIGCASNQPQQVAVEYETITPGSMLGSERNTQRARELNAQALHLLVQGKLDEAEQTAKTALSHDVAFGPAHNTLGQIYYKTSRYYLAAWEFQYAAQLMPHHPEPRNNLGLVLEAVGKYQKALTEYDQALALQPDNSQIIGNLARTHDKFGDQPERLRELLIEIVMKDDRPAWRQWAKNRLAMLGHPITPDPRNVPASGDLP